MALKEFLGVLKRSRVSMLVDVRELPVSRKPGFAKAALSAALEESGIKYEHLADLGCPRDVRHGYREDRDRSRYTRTVWHQPRVCLESNQAVEILVDRASLETFVNQGEISSMRFVLPSETGLSVRPDGGAVTVRSLVVHPLNTAWTEAVGDNQILVVPRRLSQRGT